MGPTLRRPSPRCLSHLCPRPPRSPGPSPDAVYTIRAGDSRESRRIGPVVSDLSSFMNIQRGHRPCEP